MYWYVLFVRTVQEFKVEQLLKERLDSDLFMPFVPLREIFFKKAGIMKKELKPLFPGYVFVESELSNREFIKKVRTLIYNSRSIFSLLKYSVNFLIKDLIFGESFDFQFTKIFRYRICNEGIRKTDVTNLMQ